jgi:carboxyl-terminal processing protease
LLFKSSFYRSPIQTTLAVIIALPLCLSLGFVLLGCASDATVESSENTPAVPASLSPERLALHVESFEYVWSSVKDKHWDPDLNGIDWDQAKIDLLPAVQSATSDDEARAVINELLSRLEQSHFGIIPSTSYERLEEESTAHEVDRAENSAGDSEPGWAGLNVRLVDQQFLVTKVVPGSPADRAGIKAGWILDSIRDRQMSTLIEVTSEIDGVMRPETQAGLIVHSRLGGNAGDTINMTFSDDLLETREISLTLDPSPGVMGGIGELPEMPIEVETDTLTNGIGYFRLSMFMSPGTVLPTYQQFIKDHKDAPGIVIDMRGNFGGIILMAPGMINWLIDEKGLMGTMKMRDPVRGAFEIPLMLNPRKNHYTGKVAVLIDELSISNAEILSAGLKDIGRARIFGTRTAGLALPSTVERLPNGDGFQYAFADYTTSGGYSLEAHGTVPDVDIRYTQEALLNGHDEVLDAATEWIIIND